MRRPRPGAPYERVVPTAAARVREAGEPFSESFDQLKRSVRRSCARQAEWEAKVVAGVQAAVEFAAENPAKGLALTVEARRGSDEVPPAQRVIEFFATQLTKVAPEADRVPVSTDESVVEAIAVIVRGHLLAGTADRLPQTAPDLVYLALLPYLGIAETRAWTMALSIEP